MLISDTGVVIEPSQTAVARAQQILIDAYGADVNLDAQSPNGQLVQSQALAITEREADEANTIGSMNPNIATGAQLSAICANLDIEKIPATSSTAECTFTGLVGVTIPAGKQVSSTAGNLFELESTVVIGIGGTATGSVVALETGPIPTTANTINQIIQGVNGWSTVNNPLVGTVGREEESDFELKLRRVDSLGFSSSGSYESILAGAAALSPISYYLVENDTEVPIVRDGITLPTSSILLTLDGGGSDEDVALMLQKRKSGGCKMVGNQTKIVPIPNSPELFTAKWQIAVQKALGLTIQLKLGVVYPPDVAVLIASVINAKFDFNVIGRFIDATQFIFLLMSSGILPIISLTFNVGSTTGLIQYTMPVTDSLGSSMLSGNITVSYV